LNTDALDLLFIENVGNLICPAEFPLGSEKRIVVTSVTEGPYMITKHPLIFMGADVVVINKIDLSAAMGTQIDILRRDVSNINPKATVIPTNCRDGIGIKEVVSALDLS
jgi:hydrogenase nickel incorporation protein HypB